MTFTYEYARPAVAVDCVVFTFSDNELKLLLIERLFAPFVGTWALPGGFVDIEETTDNAARRELLEETGLNVSRLKQFHTFSDVDRDPRDRVISVAYLGFVHSQDATIVAGSDAKRAAWYPLSSLPELAFDHASIISTAVAFMQMSLSAFPLAWELLDDHFTIDQLKLIYQHIMGREIVAGEFETKILALGVLQPVKATHPTSTSCKGLYCMNFERLKQFELEGLGFWNCNCTS
ncbi:MAG TPA: NUDIX hydrolase [Pirellulaceae bacterium]|nr:NUDIX hydrolase [Pirellulaceae bacterium]HMO92172.1 NUDIX hydrolase [Pirellulaceae bacterium]HMP68901.1 NUDIX hydrolase [Pirellulaceae bacterium]